MSAGRAPAKRARRRIARVRVRHARLRTLQRQVQKHVLAGAALPAGVAAGAALRVRQRLAIYRDGYYLRLSEALGESFPMLRKLLGDAQFESLARRYADSRPSRHYTLRYFGDGLPKLLAATAPYRRHGVLADMARWEWLMAAAFDAADARAMSSAELELIPPARWPDLRLRLHPSVRCITPRWNAPALWAALHRDAAPPEPERTRSSWVLWREDLKVRFAELTGPESRALARALRRASLTSICEAAPHGLDPQAAAGWVAALLRHWIERRWIVAAETGNS